MEFRSLGQQVVAGMLIVGVIAGACSSAPETRPSGAASGATPSSQAPVPSADQQSEKNAVLPYNPAGQPNPGGQQSAAGPVNPGGPPSAVEQPGSPAGAPPAGNPSGAPSAGAGGIGPFGGALAPSVPTPGVAPTTAAAAPPNNEPMPEVRELPPDAAPPVPTNAQSLPAEIQHEASEVQSAGPLSNEVQPLEGSGGVTGSRQQLQATSNVAGQLLHGGFESVEGWGINVDSPGASGSARHESTPANVHGGTRSVQISSSVRTITQVRRALRLKLYADYRLEGWIKTDRVDGRGAFLNVVGVVQGNYLAASSREITGTQSWQKVTVEFYSGHNEWAAVGCSLGEAPDPYYKDVGDGKRSSGTVWCDDLVLTEVASLGYAHGAGRSVNVYPYRRAGHGDFRNLSAYVSNLDQVYTHLADLGGCQPYGGRKINLYSAPTMRPFALSGETVLVNGSVAWASVANSGGNFDWSMPHELGHDFDSCLPWDLYIGGKQLHNGEHWANIKALYALDQMSRDSRYSALRVNLHGSTKSLSQAGQSFADYATRTWLSKSQSQRQQGIQHQLSCTNNCDAGRIMDNDTYTGLLYGVVRELGWDGFKRTMQAYPAAKRDGAISPNEEAKVKLLADLMSRQYGRDLKPRFREWGFSFVN